MKKVEDNLRRARVGFSLCLFSAFHLFCFPTVMTLKRTKDIETDDLVFFLGYNSLLNGLPVFIFSSLVSSPTVFRRILQKWKYFIFDSLLKSFNSFHCLQDEVHVYCHNYKTTQTISFYLPPLLFTPLPVFLAKYTKFISIP